MVWRSYLELPIMGYPSLQEEPMAKLVTTTCKPKIVLNHHNTGLCKGVGVGEGLYTGYHCTRMSGLVFIVVSNNDLWTLILDQRMMIHWQSYNADAEGEYVR